MSRLSELMAKQAKLTRLKPVLHSMKMNKILLNFPSLKVSKFDWLITPSTSIDIDLKKWP